MKKKLAILVFVIPLLSFSQGKSEFIYYDWDGNETSYNSNNYGYYRRIEKNSNNQIITISDFYKGGQLNQILYIENVYYPRAKRIMEMKITGIQVIYHGDLSIYKRIVFKDGSEVDSKVVNELQKTNSVNSDNHEAEMSRIIAAKNNTWSLIGVAASAYGFYKLITYCSNNSSSNSTSSYSSSNSNSSNKKPKPTPGIKESRGVELLAWGSTANFWTAGNNSVRYRIRNKNSYAVNVKIALLNNDGEWEQDYQLHYIPAGEIREFSTLGRAWQTSKDIRLDYIE